MKPRQTKFLTRGIVMLMECGWKLDSFPVVSKSGRPATRYALTRGGPRDAAGLRDCPASAEGSAAEFLSATTRHSTRLTNN